MGIPGKRLFLSPETVRTHVQKAMRRLEADTRTSLSQWRCGSRSSAEARHFPPRTGARHGYATVTEA
jgi:hypothetical protein